MNFAIGLKVKFIGLVKGEIFFQGFNGSGSVLIKKSLHKSYLNGIRGGYVSSIFKL